MENIELDNKHKKRLVKSLKEDKECSDFARYSSESDFQNFINGMDNGWDYMKDDMLSARKKFKNMTEEEYQKYIKENINSRVEMALKSYVSKYIDNIEPMSTEQLSKKEKILSELRNIKEAFVNGVDVDLMEPQGILQAFATIPLTVGGLAAWEQLGMV